MEMKVADVIVKCLEAEGIEYAFGIVGYHYMPLFKALENSSIKIISVKHENAAGLSALHYARLAQKPALVLGTAGPGATNLVTGIAEIYKANLPCFIITPIVPNNLLGKNSCQEDSGHGNSYSIQGIMQQITKESLVCSTPQNIAEYIHDLFRYSLSGRKGPVHLLLPVNHIEQTIPWHALNPIQYRCTNDKSVDIDKIALLADKIKSAKNPIILVGQRAWYPSISAQIQLLSNRYNIPVILSAGAKGLFDEFSLLFGGIIDLYGHRSAEVFIKRSDLIISFGEDFGEFTTLKYDPNLFNGQLIQIDVDGYEIGRNYPVELGICGNLGSSIEYLIKEMEHRNIGRFVDPVRFHKEFIKENSFLNEEINDISVPLKPQAILSKISNLSPKDVFILSDIGKIGLFTLRYLKNRENSYSSSPANYSMAQAVAGAIGAKAAAPDRIIIVLCGDGSFLMNCMEIATAIQYNLPIIWIVFVDRSLGNVEWAYKMMYKDNESFTDIFVPNLAKFAEAFDINYCKIDDIESLEKFFPQIINSYKSENKCAVVQVNFDKDESLPVKPQLVKFIQECSSKEEFNPPPYFMKAFKRMLREKV